MLFKFKPRAVIFLPVALGIALLSAQLFASGAATAPTGPLPRWPMLLLCGVIALIGVVLTRLKKMWDELDKGQRAQRVLGLTLLSVGLYGLAFAATEAPPIPKQRGEGLGWYSSYELARSDAERTNRPLMIDFSAQWCNACHELEAEVFMQPEISAKLSAEFVLLKVDFDEQTAQNMDLVKRFEVSGLPRVAFEGAQGQLLKGAWFEGKLAKESFLQKLEAALKGSSEGAKSEFEQTLGEQGLLAALLLVFLAGLLSSLTPCVYPLIPITIGLFGARQAKSRLEGFSLSLTYVIGIAITYSIMGVAAASFGTLFGSAMQSPWVLGGLALMFVALGLSSLGVIHVRLPGNLQTVLGQRGGAGYAGALVMGLVAGIIAAPCVGPIVAGVLVYVAKQQDLLLGWLMMMTFALGMGMLFLVLGTSSSLLGRLPKAGAWMDGVKTFFGALFFAMALYYLRYMVDPLTDGAKAVWGIVAGW